MSVYPVSSFSESHTSHGRARHQIRDWSESGRSRELLTPGTSDSCRPRGVVTRDFSTIFDRLFDRLPVRISTSDLHHWILRKKIFHIRAYDFGVQFSFNEVYVHVTLLLNGVRGGGVQFFTCYRVCGCKCTYEWSCGSVVFFFFFFFFYFLTRGNCSFWLENQYLWLGFACYRITEFQTFFA